MLAKGDFVELELTGTIAQTEQSFIEEKSLVICIGAGQLLPGLESALEGKEVGQKLELELKPEQAYGVRDTRLIQLVPLAKFAQNNINPIPGLQVNVDGLLATVRSVNGGRVLVDFNHPLAGKVLKFKIEIKRKVEDLKEKIKALMPEAQNIELEENKVTITTKGNLPKKLEELKINSLKAHIKELENKEIALKKEESPEKTSKKGKKSEEKA